MGQRLLERRLRAAGRRLSELRRELSVVEDQLSHLAADAEDKELRALVSETAHAFFEHREASTHATAMADHRASLRLAIAEQELKIDELLEKMSSSRSRESTS